MKQMTIIMKVSNRVRIYKLIFLLTVMALVLTACAASTEQFSYDEKSAPKAMDNFNEADIIGRMTDLKNGLKPNLKPSGKTDDAAAEGSGQEQASGQKQLEELTKQYDSAILKTNFGDITVKFYSQESPITVNNFLNLAKAGFYNGVKFHRVMKDFMIQGGDPNSKDDDWSNDGRGGPGYQFQDEFNSHKLVKGSLAMANSGPNTNGSQFFIVTTEATPWLDGKHTNVVYVTAGLDVVDKIENVNVNENDHPTEDVTINNIELVKINTGGQAQDMGPATVPTPETASTSPEEAN